MIILFLLLSLWSLTKQACFSVFAYYNLLYGRPRANLEEHIVIRESLKLSFVSLSPLTRVHNVIEKVHRLSLLPMPILEQGHY